MSCLKCGKKTAEDQSFCLACLETMDAYPVKSDVHLQLPNRADAPTSKKSPRKRRALSAEEQMAGLRRKVRRLTGLSALLLALLILCAALLAQNWIAAEGLKLPLFDCFT